MRQGMGTMLRSRKACGSLLLRGRRCIPLSAEPPWCAARRARGCGSGDPWRAARRLWRTRGRGPGGSWRVDGRFSWREMTGNRHSERAATRRRRSGSSFPLVSASTRFRPNGRRSARTRFSVISRHESLFSMSSQGRQGPGRLWLDAGFGPKRRGSRLAHRLSSGKAPRGAGGGSGGDPELGKRHRRDGRALGGLCARRDPCRFGATSVPKRDRCGLRPPDIDPGQDRLGSKIGEHGFVSILV